MRRAVVVILLAGAAVAGARARWGATAAAEAVGAGGLATTAGRDQVTGYDRAGDRTTLASGPVRLADGFDIAASFAVRGRAKAGAPLVPGVTLTVTGPLDVSRTGTGEIVDVTVQYGGSAKTKLGRVARDGRTASVALAPAVFAAFAGSGDAAVRVGASTIRLTPEAREAFRELASRFAGR